MLAACVSVKDARSQSVMTNICRTDSADNEELLPPWKSLFSFTHDLISASDVWLVHIIVMTA
jgi:hypothetical protein